MATWISVTGQIGLSYPGSIDSVKSTAIGTVARFRSESLGEGEFIYLSGAASVDAGDVCSYEITYNASVATSVVAPWAGATNMPVPLCVATASTVAGTWGWYQVSGSAVVNSSGVIADGDDLFWQAAGVVSASLASGAQMMNAVAASANGVPATNKVIVTIDRPLAQGSADVPTIDVRSFGVTMNGTTDDTTGVIAAVAAAAASVRALYWPPGTALTTASIPLLHTVRHTGPGLIKRGSTFFTLSPRSNTTNHIFVSPTGSATADGITASQPTMPQAAATALLNYGPVLIGTWQIDFAAGSYAGFLFDVGLTSLKNIRLIGPPTGDFISTPTAIIDKALSGSITQGIYCSGPGKRVFIKDIKAIGFADDFEAGFRAQEHAHVFYENCHAADCWYGLYHLDFTVYHVKGGIIDDCYIGVQELFTNIRDFKYAGSTADRTVIRNCTFGAHFKELCTGHLDFASFQDNTYGAMLVRGSTANPADCDFRRNGIGVVLSGRSIVVDAGDVTWNGQPVTSASWSASVATFGFGIATNVAIGERFDITGASPAGYNGTYTALAGSTSTSLKGTLVSDPGAWVSGGRSNANTIHILPLDPQIVETVGGNPELEILPPYVGQSYKTKSDVVVAASLTGTLTLTNIMPLTGFKKGEFQAVGYRVKMFAAGNYTLANPADLYFRVGTSALGVFALTAGTNKVWTMESVLVITATGDNQRYVTTLQVEGETVQIEHAARTTPFSTLDLDFGIWGQLTNIVGDTIAVDFALLETTCG